MKCPTCAGVDLVMSERSGVEIDYCPTCRGVWLDRGELDKIIERSLPQSQPSPAPGRQDALRGYQEDHHQDKHGQYGNQGRRRGWLGDIFD
jgi:Zn-finger nucleic acid-binding protein